MGADTTTEQIYRHGLNKGGLDDILANQRLLATEARVGAGGAAAVRAMNGPFHEPYKGTTVGIEFTTTVKGVPTRYMGMEGTFWPMEEGQYLKIEVRKVIYPDGRVVTYEPRTPAPVREQAPPPVQEQVPPPPKPEVPSAGPRLGGGRAFLDRVKKFGKVGLKAIFSVEFVVMLGAEVLLAVADRAAAEAAIKKLQIFFIKEGVAKGVAAAVMRWSEDEVETEALNRVTEFRLQRFRDPAGLLSLSSLFNLATAYENLAVAHGYLWASQQPDSWKKAILDKGTKRLAEAGYDHRRKADSYFFEYEFLARLSWALRQHMDPIVDRALR